MTKKELLTILILAALVTGLSWLYSQPTLIHRHGADFLYGFPFPFLQSIETFGGTKIFEWRWISLAGNLFFWFLVLTAAWWILKSVLKKIRMKNG